MKKTAIWLVLITLVITQVQSSASPNSDLVSGCINKKTLILRIVEKCSASEKKIQWSQNGPAGKEGIAGVNGVDGTDGKDGLDGKDGVDGKDGINGRDGVPGIAGPKGEIGKDGSLNTVYWAYIKSKDVLTTSSRKVVVVNSRNLGLPVGASGQHYRFEASVDITTKSTSQAWVGCFWTTQATLDKDAGGWGDFDSEYTVGYISSLRPRAVMFLSKLGDEVILVCTVSENASITGGYVSAEAVNSISKGTIGD